ncbi:hypothetical protein PFISCL1PPCAC_22655, partial [Pristionchus fissidentatus]
SMSSVESAVAPQSPPLQENGADSNGSCGAHDAEARHYSSDPCAHRAKKKLISSKDVRKALKENNMKCGECSRKKEANGVPVKTDDGEPVSICLACGSRVCGVHAITHSEAKRSDGEHCFFWDKENTGNTRCEVCRVTLDLSDAPPNDPIKMLFNDIKSFMKIKGKSDKSETSAQSDAKTQPAVLDKPEPKPEKKAHTASSTSNGTSSEDGKKRNGVKTNGVSHSSSAELPSSANGSNGVYANGTGNGDKARKALSLPKSTAVAAKGLSNLGNTCFFNSVMQCIMHTHQLSFYLERFGRVTRLNFIKPAKPVVVNDEKIDIEEATLSIRDSSTPLNDALRAFIVDFRNGRTPSPNCLFNEIAKRATRFRSMAQQDAHELLRYLLDGLCSEETGRYQEAIAALVGAPLKGATKVEPALVRKAKAYLQLAGRPLLDAVFGGRLLQTIRCSKCHHVSERYENFYDLSVPLTGGVMGGRPANRSNGVHQQSSSSTSATSHRQPASKHQKKKEAKAAKAASRKGGRTAKTVENSKTAGGTIEDQMSRLSMVDEESETGDSEEEGEKGEQKEKKRTNGHANGHGEGATASQEEAESSGGEDEHSDEEEEDKVVDPLDLTKVLTTMTTSLPSGQSIAASLLEFTAEERLEGTNAYECEKCCTPANKKKGATGAAKTRVAATKRYLIVTPPAVLTLHVKRFQQIHHGMKMTTRKVSGHVHFPLVFDIAPFCCKNVERIGSGQTRVLYALYGVVVHSGDLGGGHYVAYVKSRERLQQMEEMVETARAICADVQAEAARLPAALPPPDHAEKDLPQGQWYYCSDSRVSAVSESKVLGVEAYLLFYERIC